MCGFVCSQHRIRPLPPSCPLLGNMRAPPHNPGKLEERYTDFARSAKEGPPPRSPVSPTASGVGSPRGSGGGSPPRRASRRLAVVPNDPDGTVGLELDKESTAALVGFLDSTLGTFAHLEDSAVGCAATWQGFGAQGVVQPPPDKLEPVVVNGAHCTGEGKSELLAHLDDKEENDWRCWAGLTVWQGPTVRWRTQASCSFERTQSVWHSQASQSHQSLPGPGSTTSSG